MEMLGSELPAHGCLAGHWGRHCCRAQRWAACQRAHAAHSSKGGKSWGPRAAAGSPPEQTGT